MPGYGDGFYGGGIYADLLAGVSAHKAVRASYTVEVAWGQGAVGLFTFGISTFGGTDTLAASGWSQTFGGPNDNITAPGDDTHVDRITILRGREDDLSATRAGELTLEITDPHGKYNVKNTLSVLYGQLKGNRPVRVTAHFGGVSYPLFYGFIDQIMWEPRGRKGVAEIHALDLFTRMEQNRPVLASAGATTTGAAIGRILDKMSWTDPAMRSLATGDSIPDFLANTTVAPGGGDNILQLIENLLIAERGFVFINRAGVATYKSRDQRRRDFAVGSLSNVMNNMQIVNDNTRVINRWTIVRTDTAGNVLGSVTVEDDASAHDYDFRDDQVTTPYLWTDSQATDLGNYLLQQTANPLGPVWDLPIHAGVDGLTMVQCLARDLNDRVTISEAKVGTSLDYFIEQIKHDIDAQHGSHDTSWKLTERPGVGNPFIFGVSTFGGTDLFDY